MLYQKARYVSNNSTAIQAYSDEGEPWCSVTINLEDYGLDTEGDNYVYIPAYKLDRETLATLMQDLVDTVIKKEWIGWDDSCECWYVRLKADWEERCTYDKE